MLQNNTVIIYIYEFAISSVCFFFLLYFFLSFLHLYRLKVVLHLHNHFHEDNSQRKIWRYENGVISWDRIRILACVEMTDRAFKRPNGNNYWSYITHTHTSSTITMSYRKGGSVCGVKQVDQPVERGREWTKPWSEEWSGRVHGAKEWSGPICGARKEVDWNVAKEGRRSACTQCGVHANANSTSVNKTGKRHQLLPWSMVWNCIGRSSWKVSRWNVLGIRTFCWS